VLTELAVVAIADFVSEIRQLVPSSPRDCGGTASLRSSNWSHGPWRDVPVGCMRTAKHRQNGEGAFDGNASDLEAQLSNPIQVPAVVIERNVGRNQVIRHDDVAAFAHQRQ